MENENKTRRAFLHSTMLATAGLALAPMPAAAQAEGLTGGVLTADLMHDHGIVRHALAIYQNVAFRLTNGPLEVREQAVLSKALNETARIFRELAENYHARAIEEKLMFPRVMQMQAPLSRYPAILMAQHERGREMTSYLLDATRDGRLPVARAPELAKALHAFKQMYEQHGVHEDTVVYVAWQRSLSEAGLREMREAFAELEHRMVGPNAFENALERMGAIENNLGIADLQQFTMPDILSY